MTTLQWRIVVVMIVSGVASILAALVFISLPVWLPRETPGFYETEKALNEAVKYVADEVGSTEPSRNGTVEERWIILPRRWKDLSVDGEVEVNWANEEQYQIYFFVERDFRYMRAYVYSSDGTSPWFERSERQFREKWYLVESR